MPSGEWMGNFTLCIIKLDRCRCLPDIFPYIKSKHPREFNDRVHCTATQLLVTLNWIHDSFAHNAVPCICFQYYLCHVIYSALKVHPCSAVWKCYPRHWCIELTVICTCTCFHSGGSGSSVGNALPVVWRDSLFAWWYVCNSDCCATKLNQWSENGSHLLLF